jgi:hypothetical protein
MVAATNTPSLIITGPHDGQVPPGRVHDLYTDLGSIKVLVGLACSSHNMWEKNHRLLFQTSLKWLLKGTVNGVDRGKVRLGY